MINIKFYIKLAVMIFEHCFKLKFDELLIFKNLNY